MDVDAYRRASHAIWETAATGWDARHAYLERVSQPVTERMLEQLEAQPGDTILELAAGTGVVGLSAALASDGGVRLIISDFAQAMVDAARQRGTQLGLENVDYRVLDAEHLDLPDDSVDGVLCRWGYMLVPDPAAAFAETRRVLRPGGRLSCAVFGPPESNPWASFPAGVLVERGHLPPPEAGAPGILALGDAARLRGLIVEAGFSEPTIDEIGFSWTYSSKDDYWQFLTSVAGAIAMVLGRLDESEREATRTELLSRLGDYADPNGGYTLPARCLVACAS
jgi:SAM-dependent methyltransferase